MDMKVLKLEIAKLEFSHGDIVVLRVPKNTRQTTFTAMSHGLEEITRGTGARAMIITDDMEIMVLTSVMIDDLVIKESKS